MHRRVLVTLTLSALLAACGPQQLQVAATPTQQGATLAATAAIEPTAPTGGEVTTEGYPVFDPVTAEGGYPGGDPGAAITVGQVGEPPADAPETTPGTASISGVMVAREGGMPIIDAAFYLTLGQGDDQTFPPDYISDPDPTRGDVSGKTDTQGQFTAVDIPPGKYFLFVWGPYGWREVEAGADDQSPIHLILAADTRTPLGIVHVSWP